MSVATNPTDASAAPSDDPQHWVDVLADRLSDRLNPILVKETRQALKSRQFTISFWLVLLFAIGWSFMGISLQLPHVYYLPSGQPMLTGYYIILCVPLLLIVPFSAYRSLAMEKEDGTYELLSITSLSARQIVTGKLGSALMQIFVYYAALAPCIGFTYLLRGVDLGTIFIILVGTFLASVLLCTVGIVFAGASRSRQWQSLTSVVLLLLLLAGTWAWGFPMLALVWEGGSIIYTSDFALAIAFALTMYATFMVLFVFLAAAQNSFVTDNRSTKLRITMLVQQLCFTGWMTYYWLSFNDDDFAPVLPFVSAGIWMVYGSLMTGEVAELSPRARRDLPRSFFGRTFLTWFNPGASTGFTLSVAVLLAVVLFTMTVNLLASSYRPEMSFDVDRFCLTCTLLWCYATAYLGSGRLVILALRRVSEFGLAAAVMIHWLLLVAGCAIPYFLVFWLNDFRNIEYSELQMTNWLWTLERAMFGAADAWTVILPVAGMAIAILATNLVLAAREVDATRIDVPERVRQDGED